MSIQVFSIDPDWTAWAKCPIDRCKSVTHACCNFHAIQGIKEHMKEEHDA